VKRTKAAESEAAYKTNRAEAEKKAQRLLRGDVALFIKKTIAYGSMKEAA